MNESIIQTAFVMEVIGDYFSRSTPDKKRYEVVELSWWDK